ncbi:unnamed protein product [Trichogramma brassicae]|uniref:Uncharacterized protein n=1 Tax=Trichogramma brassicae TaxID=86971 RepID=A0A6H5HV05_9HYME|nr:unnamed protein product [Trichogramma brassicae]
MNTTVNQTTGFCPLEIQTGQRPERFWTKYVPDFRQQQSHNQICDKARANIEKIGNKRAEMWNKNHKITTLKIGDLVLVKALRVPSSKAQRVAKLLSLYEGPYVVTRIFPEATYELGNPRTQKSRGRYHISNIRPYFLDEGQGEEKGEEAGEDRPGPTNRTVCAAQKDQEETTTPRGSPPCNPDRAEASSGRQPGLLLETAGERSRGSPTIGEADRGSVKINPHKKNGKESEEDSWSETSALSTASTWVDERHRGQDAPRALPSVSRKRRADDDHDSPRQRQQRTMLMHSWLKEMHGKEINWIPPMFLPPRAPIKPAAEWTSPCSTRPPSRRLPLPFRHTTLASSPSPLVLPSATSNRTGVIVSYALEYDTLGKIPCLPGEHRRRVHLSTWCIEGLSQGDTLGKIPRLPGEHRRRVHMSTWCIEGLSQGDTLGKIPRLPGEHHRRVHMSTWCIEGLSQVLNLMYRDHTDLVTRTLSAAWRWSMYALYPHAPMYYTYPIVEYSSIEICHEIAPLPSITSSFFRNKPEDKKSSARIVN